MKSAEIIIDVDGFKREKKIFLNDGTDEDFFWDVIHAVESIEKEKTNKRNWFFLRKEKDLGFTQ